MESEGSLPLFKIPATYAYSEPDKSSPCRLISHPKDPF